MITSRRNFLKTGTVGLLCAGMPVAFAKVVISRSADTSGFLDASAKSLGAFTKDTFMAHLNTTFRIRTSSAFVDLKLANVTDLKAISRTPAKNVGKECFSLLFVDSRKKTSLSQDTYLVEHDALGTFSLFLVPVGMSSNRNHEAIINRL